MSGDVVLTDAEREALAEYALVVGTFLIGRWAEVMASDDEPADDWQDAAAREAVALFAPMGDDLLCSRVAALTQGGDVSGLADRLTELLSAARDTYGCHGITTVDGEQDACGKPATVIIDGRGTEDETYWPACTYHGHRYGGGRVVPLADILAVVETLTDALESEAGT